MLFILKTQITLVKQKIITPFYRELRKNNYKKIKKFFKKVLAKIKIIVYNDFRLM